ncbi:MAG TPA: cytochrome c oxidase subunit II [Candidatus Limnocylindrales bacterium]|nr:cytochrome c oxidase subunit II [Candidatus Limnocylindrales bacterium]
MSSSPRRRIAPEAVIAAVVVILLVVLVPLVVYSKIGESLFPPDAVTKQAQDVRSLYNIVFAIAVAIFVAVEGLIVWSVIRYRRKPGDDELPAQTHGNTLIEIIWTAIPTVIVLFLFGLSFNTLATVDAVGNNPDIRIHAVAQQFQWTFEYLDQNGNKVATQTIPTAAEGGGMAVPVGKNVLVTLDSPDVIHAFYVPRFLFKRDVIPGQTNRFQFTIDPSEATDGHPEILSGQCAELCGTGHRTMLFNVIAMSQNDYDAWLQALITKSNATPPPAPSVGAGATLNVTAQNIAFDTKSLTVAAGQPFAIDFVNKDPAGVDHNIQIRDASGNVIADPPLTDGGQSATYTYQALPPGTYTFICKVHPIAAMTGTLTVH